MRRIHGTISSSYACRLPNAGGLSRRDDGRAGRHRHRQSRPWPSRRGTAGSDPSACRPRSTPARATTRRPGCADVRCFSVNGCSSGSEVTVTSYNLRALPSGRGGRSVTSLTRGDDQISGPSRIQLWRFNDDPFRPADPASPQHSSRRCHRLADTAADTGVRSFHICRGHLVGRWPVPRAVLRVGRPPSGFRRAAREGRRRPGIPGTAAKRA